MTGSRGDGGPHIDDGDLIRLSDGECSPEEAKQIRTHIDDCSECKDNSDTLANTSVAFSSLLAELEPTVPLEVVRGGDLGAPTLPPKTHRFQFVSPRAMKAAAVLAVTVLVFTATPARALFLQGWEVLRSLVTATTSELPISDEVPEIATPEPSSVISFTPRGPTFRLEFTRRPASGTLVLLFDSAATASAGLVGGDGTDGIVLLPGGLRVHNSTSSFGSYQLQLPLSLSSVHVYMAGSVELVIDVKSAPGPFIRELDLSGEQGR